MNAIRYAPNHWPGAIQTDDEPTTADGRIQPVLLDVPRPRRVLGTGAPRPKNASRPDRWPPSCPEVQFGSYDLTVVCDSGGKDGQDAAAWTVDEAARQGALNSLLTGGRLVVLHNHLGERASWPATTDAGEHAQVLTARYGDRPGTAGVAAAHAAFYGGLRYIQTDDEGGDLLDAVEARGQFPDSGRRWCTSNLKRGPSYKVLTRLVRELDLPKGRAARILYISGIRAQESPGRAKRPAFAPNPGASGQGSVRQVDNFYPVHHWSTDQVWDRIHTDGAPYAWPYDAGMTRLSCPMCVLAGWDDLTLAAALLPHVAGDYQQVERSNVDRSAVFGGVATGRTFQANRTVTDIIAGAAGIDIVA